MTRSPLAVLACAALLASCATPDSRGHADELAAGAGMQRDVLQGGRFQLVTYVRITRPGAPLDLYIEGDGRAWLSAGRLSDDPTPRRAIGLQLAAADPAPNVAYLARPCQYVDLRARPCDPAYWSGKRFAPEVIDAMDDAIGQLARRAGAGGLNLVGYSGGAAIAVLVAARRQDVLSLRTVAGNLSVERVNALHRVDAMPDSLDPIDAAPDLARLPQIHFAGARDKVIPPGIAQAFAAHAGNPACVRVATEDSADHEQPWAERWPRLLEQVPRCD
jgi:hypothetical protein